MKLYKVIFSFSILLFLGYLIFLAVKFSSIHETIPIHYSSEGADGFGSKIFLWFEAAINAIILIFIGLILLFPEKMFRKTDEYLESSLEAAIKNRQIFLSVLSVLITVLFCGLYLKEIMP